jgi:hypothetical protein
MQVVAARPSSFTLDHEERETGRSGVDATVQQGVNVSLISVRCRKIDHT